MCRCVYIQRKKNLNNKSQKIPPPALLGGTKPVGTWYIDYLRSSYLNSSSTNLNASYMGSNTNLANNYSNTNLGKTSTNQIERTFFA